MSRGKLELPGKSELPSPSTFHQSVLLSSSLSELFGGFEGPPEMGVCLSDRMTWSHSCQPTLIILYRKKPIISALECMISTVTNREGPVDGLYKTSRNDNKTTNEMKVVTGNIKPLKDMFKVLWTSGCSRILKNVNTFEVRANLRCR